jgi:peptidoglycan/xylan/chitin deacetylase (PgdA/CDA1 family)
LTFDDGPHPELTDAVLDVLARHDARATFFLIGERIAGQERSVARIVAEGHEIGNHLMRDEASILLPRNQFSRDLRATQELLAPYQRVRWWRPGSGWLTSSMVRHASGLGLRCALGTMAIMDGPPPATASWRGRRLLAQLRPGSVAVLHEGTSERRDVVSTTDWLLSQLRHQGLSSVTLSDLATA